MDDSDSSTYKSMEDKCSYLLDKTKTKVWGRWIFSLIFVLIYFYRVYFLKGWYIVTYMLGIYVLNQMIGFLSPQFDPDEDSDGVDLLPTTTQDVAADWRPFSRRLPEYPFWYSCTRAIFISYIATFFEIFDIPVFWPILLMYFFILFFLTMKKQILHMIKYKYIPVSLGKPTYTAVSKEKAAEPVEK